MNMKYINDLEGEGRGEEKLERRNSRKLVEIPGVGVVRLSSKAGGDSLAHTRWSGGRGLDRSRNIALRFARHKGLRVY
jgi:hypothetical protein